MNFVLRGKLASAHPYSLDKTLTVVGAAAEANATGKAIAEAKKATKDHVDNKANPHNVTAKQLGLENVDNTSDEEKPVSTLQAKAIADAKKAGTDAQVTADAKTQKTEAIVELAVSGWTDLTQTVEVSGVTEDNTVIVGAAPASYIAYADSNVRCTGQGEGTLIFACDEKPSTNLTVNVLILD